MLVNWPGKINKDKVKEVFENTEKILNELGEEKGLLSLKNLIVNKKGKSEAKVAIDGTRYSVPSLDTKELRY